ncbi:MAG: hypothetical protein HC774_06375 [Sphingomonadales bacterium]|nr:hypothetical protein [Sphingomonadales bacterium]
MLRISGSAARMSRAAWWTGEAVATVVGRYHDIVPDRRIIYTEVISEPGTLQGMSLVSAEFLPAGSGTRKMVAIVDLHRRRPLKSVLIDRSQCLSHLL